MKVKEQKPNSTLPPKSAYLLLAGIFAICYAVIYIALILRVHFLSHDNVSGMSEIASELLFAVMMLLVFIALYMYLVFSRTELLFNLKQPGAIMTVFTGVIVINIFVSWFSPYCMLVSLTAMLAMPFAKKREAFVFNVFACTVCSSALVITMDSANMSAIVYTFLVGVVSGAVGVYAFPNAMTRLFSIIRAFVTVAAMVAAYALLLIDPNVRALISDSFMYIGIAAAAQILLVNLLGPIVESVFNITTDFKLVELTNHKAPLIHRLIVEAPGTFNHSLAVANFAEICATAIGEDPYLARACAYYHDVGKLNNAMYFTENQAGYNPHDELLPEVSADIIRQHTVDGYELCRHHGIPEEIAKVTVEHHGTLPITYFYNKAKTLTDSDVNIDEYKYHGETPTGKIAAIIMICDSAEAAIRAMDNPDGEKVDKLLQSMIADRLNAGQFDNCDITMKELNTVRGAIVGAYGGLFHKRIKYDNGAKRGGYEHD